MKQKDKCSISLLEIMITITKRLNMNVLSEEELKGVNAGIENKKLVVLSAQ